MLVGRAYTSRVGSLRMANNVSSDVFKRSGSIADSVCSNASDEDLDLARLNLPEEFKNENISLNNNYNDLCDDTCSESGDMTIEETLAVGVKTFEIFTNNRYVEGFELLEKYSDVSMAHALGVSLCYIVGAVLEFQTEKLPAAWVSLDHAMSKINRKRKHRSVVSTFVNTVMFQNNYSDYSDINCHAELFFAATQACQTVLTILDDQTITGFVKSAIRIRACFQTYKECQRILKYRKHWDSESNKRHFESGLYLGLGLFEVAISFFPSKMITVLEMAGFSGDRTSGVDELLKCADITDAIYYPVVAMALIVYFGFAEFFYGIGEPDVECVYGILEKFTVRTPESLAVTFGHGIRETTHGRFDEACKYYTDFTNGQTTMKSFHYFSNWQKIWVYAAQWNWAEASNNATFLMEKCSWSPSMLMYIYATCAFMQAEDELDEDKSKALRVKAMDALHQAVKLKKLIGGRRAFHEKLVAENARKFIKHPNKIVLPCLDLMYLWNVFKLASYNEDCLPRIMNKVEEKLEVFTQEVDIENYSVLTFMKGVVLEHSGCPMKAMECFLEVLKHQKEMVTERHLAPQACFEIGLIYRRTGDIDVAKAWFKKARKYSDYITNVMLTYRIGYVMGLMEAQKDK